MTNARIGVGKSRFKRWVMLSVAALALIMAVFVALPRKLQAQAHSGTVALIARDDQQALADDAEVKAWLASEGFQPANHPTDVPVHVTPAAAGTTDTHDWFAKEAARYQWFYADLTGETRNPGAELTITTWTVSRTGSLYQLEQDYGDLAERAARWESAYIAQSRQHPGATAAAIR